MALIYATPKSYGRLLSPALYDDDNLSTAADDKEDELNLKAMCSRIRQRSRYMRYYPRKSTYTHKYTPGSYSSMFENKYSFLMDSYQPTLDYLRSKTQDIRHRINDLCYTSMYHPVSTSIVPRSYSPSMEEINRYLTRSEAARSEQNLLSTHVFTRSPFHYAKTGATAHLFRHFHPEDDIIERERYRQLDRDEDLKYVAGNDYLDSLRRRRGTSRLYDFQTSKHDDEISDDLKRAMRGQTPNTIAALILADCEKRIQRGRRRQRDVEQRAVRELHADYDNKYRCFNFDGEDMIKPSSRRRLKWHFGFN